MWYRLSIRELSRWRFDFMHFQPRAVARFWKWGGHKNNRRLAPKIFLLAPHFFISAPTLGGTNQNMGGHQLGNSVINAQFVETNFTVYSSNKLPSENIFLCRVKFLMLHFISYLKSSVFSLQFIVYCLLYIYLWLTLTYFIIILHWTMSWYIS